jgi:serine protease Do
MRIASRLGLLAVVFLGSSFLRAQDVDSTREEEAKRALRRTPVVELYEKWQDSIVFITFPVPKGGNPVLNEFFVVPGVPEEVGAGSGFVLHESGYLVTNAHAISPISMQVHLTNGKSYPVEVVGFDRSVDLAVVRIRPEKPLKPVILARSGDIMIGETVVVIGSPHGLRQSVVTGVVSALGREVTAPGIKLQNMIQYSAGTNPGNSGGPVFNIVGEVMGVASVTKTDAAALSFGIPVDSLRKALPRLLDIEKRQGIVTGITFAGDGSASVKAVAGDSPAVKAGLRAGDVLRRVRGQRTLSEADFHLRLIDHKPGDVLPLTVAREGKMVDVQLTLGKRPNPDTTALLATLGLKVAPLDDKLATTMRLRQPKGMVLKEVRSGVYPEKQTPEPGDVLARINDFRPENLDHVGRLLADAPPGQTIRLVFLRQRGPTLTRIDTAVNVKK